MSAICRKLGTLAYRDTCAVPGSSDYTTIAIVHGFGWSNGIFRKLEPLAAGHNTRLVLINRRDFLGSDRYTEGEQAEIAHLSSGAPYARDVMQRFMTKRAIELHDFLTDFIAQEDIPRPHGSTGGLVLAGWSYGATLVTAFLQSISRFPATDISLRAYTRRIVLFDPPYHSLGFAPPPSSYFPLDDESIPPLERPIAFSMWVSGYYDHGGPDNLEMRTPAAHPRPSVERIAPAQLARIFHRDLTVPGGSDLTLLVAGVALGVNKKMKDDALYPAQEDGWMDVEIRHLWGERSAYDMPWGAWAMRGELEEARRDGRRVRNVRLVCLPGANHFAQWDMPEPFLKALLAPQGTGPLL